MALIERGPNKPKVDLEEVLTEFKAKIMAKFRAGMQTHEFQDAMKEITTELDDLCFIARGFRGKSEEK